MNKIDERIVQMQFDNKQFENGIRTSVDSLNKLKKTLDMSESTKSLNKLDAAAKNFSLTDMSKNVEMISSRFTTMGIAGMTAIQNITNSAIESGKRILSSFTLDPITQGFDEYEIKMNAIQTILTNTMSKGTSLNDVNAALGDLNEYADQTIYNFAQMTDNIGKFTAAGVGLKDSVTSIKGLANMAAGFGVDAQRMAAATYQMSQAIAAGSVKLIDWNSLVQAGMGGEMTQKAFKDTAKSMGIFVDESKPFRETLEQGWLTSEVFIKTMDKMAKDKSLLAAATNVTTFTKLLGTMKEAIASGWASTWELIFGNKDQSTELFTGINNAFTKFVGGLTDARNAALKFWNDFGGRADVLTGIGNILITIGTVLTPIQNLFSKLIPDITGERLVMLSSGFRKLTELFLISEDSTNTLSRIFSGFAAVINMVSDGISYLLNLVWQLLSGLSPIGTFIMEMASNMADLAVGIQEVVSKFGLFDLNTLKLIVALFYEFFSKNLSTQMAFINKGFSYFASLLTGIGVPAGIFQNSLTFISGILGYISEKFKVVSSAVSTFVDMFKDAETPMLFFTSNAAGVTDANGEMTDSISLFQTVINGLKKGFAILSNIIDGIGNGIKKIVEAVKNEAVYGLESITFEKVIHAIETFLSVGILLAIRNLLKTLSTAFKGLPDVLEGVTGVLDGLKNSLETWQQGVKAKIILDIAIAVAILAGALYLISTIPQDKLIASAAAIGTLFAEVAYTTKILASTLDARAFATLHQLGLMLVALSISVSILAGAMVKMKGLSWNELIKGLAGIGVLLFGMTQTIKPLSSAAPGLASAALGMIGIAYAVKILATAVSTLSKLNWDEIFKGVGSIGAIMIALSILVNSTRNTDLLSASVGITLISASMLAFASAIAIFGNMDVSTLQQGLLVIGGLLAAFVLSFRLLPSQTDLLRAGVAVMGFAVAINLLLGAIAIFGNMDVWTIVQGMITIAATLGVLVTASNLLTGTAPASLAIIGLAAALNLLMVPIIVLGNLPLEVIGVALLAMAGSLAVLGGAAYLLAPLAPVMSLIASGIALVGLGMAGVAASVLMFAGALVFLATSAAAVYAGIPLLGKAIIGMIDAINQAIPKLGDTIDLILVVIINAIPRLIELLRKIFDGIIDLIEEYSPKIVGLFMKLVIDCADEFKKNEKEYIKAMEYVAGVLVRETRRMIPHIVREIANINKIMAKSVANEIVNWFNDDEPVKKAKDYGKEIGTNIGAGGSFGIEESTPNVAKSASEMGDAAIDAVRKAIDSNSPSEKTKDQGIYFGQGFVAGINQTTSQANSAASNMGISSAKALNDGWSNTIFGGAKPLPVKTEGSGGLSGLFKDLGGFFKKQGDKITKPLEDSVKKSTESIPKTFSDGIKNGSKGSGPAKAASDMGKQVKSAFDVSMEWIDEEKYYRRLSLQQELEAYTRMQSRYKIGSEERKKIDREIFRVKDDMTSSEIEVERKAYEHSKNWISDRKYYNELSLEQELAAWERVHARYSELSDEGKETAKEMYRVKNLLIDKEEQAKQKMFDNSKNWISEETSYDRDNMKERLDSWKRVLAREEQFYADSGKMNERLKEARLNVYNLTKSIAEKEKNLIKEAADLKKRTIKEVEDLEKEHASKVEEINKKMNDDIKNLNEEYKNAVKARTEEIYNSFTLFEKLDKEINRNKEILKLKTDLVDAEKKLNSYSEDKTIKDVSGERDLVKQQIESAKNDLKVIQRVQKENRQGTSLRVAADKQAKTRNIELSTMVEKLESLNDTQKKYDELTAKRIESEKEILKIKEDIAAKEPVSGDQLIGNLEDQVKELKTWRQNLVALEQKGLNKDLLSELRDMGPKSMDELKALNRLTKPQLDNYAGLWLEKYRLAKTQATDELENMRIESLAKTDEIRTETIKTLSKLKEESGIKIKELNDETRSNLSKVKETWSTELGNVRSESRTTFLGIVTDTKEILKNAKLGESAKDALKGFNNGLKDGLPGVKKQTVILGEAPLESVAKALQINSPSKKMFELGLYTSQGFINGIKSLSSSVVDESSSIGNNAVDSLKNIIIGIADFLSGNMDTTPTITPVLDLTNIKTGINKLNGIMANGSYSMAQRARNVQSSQGAINSLVPLLETTGASGESVNNTFAISNITIREEADIKRVARELYQLQISKNRG